MSARDKLLTRPMAVKKVKAAKRRGERVVFTNGCFDLLHVGHVRSLEQARSEGDRLIVAISSDTSVRAQRGPGMPVVPLRQRMEVVAALECVDWVLLFRDATPVSTIRALQPDVIAKGGDRSLDDIIDRREVEDWGGRMVRLRSVAGVSTTDLLGRARRSGR